MRERWQDNGSVVAGNYSWGVKIRCYLVRHIPFGFYRMIPMVECKLRDFVCRIIVPVLESLEGCSRNLKRTVTVVAVIIKYYCSATVCLGQRLVLMQERLSRISCCRRH